jgi:hypothetical protein
MHSQVLLPILMFMEFHYFWDPYPHNPPNTSQIKNFKNTSWTLKVHVINEKVNENNDISAISLSSFVGWSFSLFCFLQLFSRKIQNFLRFFTSSDLATQISTSHHFVFPSLMLSARKFVACEFLIIHSGSTWI